MATVITGEDLRARALGMAERVAADAGRLNVGCEIDRVRQIVKAHGTGEITADAVPIAGAGPDVTEAVVRLLLDVRAIERNRAVRQASTGAVRHG